MKVLIQDRDSRLYVAHESLWTDTPREARDFGLSLYASSVARNLRLRRFQVLFYFPELDYKLVAFDSRENGAANCA